MSQFATAADLRAYLDIKSVGGRALTANLDMLLIAASDFLERETGRLITASGSNTVRTFSSDGRASMTIPDLRAVGTITLQSTPLAADTTYWLLPSRQQPPNETIYTGVQFQAYGSWDYRSNPEWFDRNLDSDYWTNRRYGLPNDLVISGLWGWSAVPTSWKLVTLILAGYYYKRPDSLLANSTITAEGNQLDYTRLPPEVEEHIRAWRLGEQVVAL